jgi:hypothetical protein
MTKAPAYAPSPDERSVDGDHWAREYLAIATSDFDVYAEGIGSKT